MLSCFKHESSFKGISPEAEAFAVMVGVVEFLDRPGKQIKAIPN